MKLIQIIVIVSMVMWLLPLLKQRNTKYFYYFFALSLCDPIRMLTFAFLKYGMTRTDLLLHLLIIASLVDNKMIRKYIIIIALLNIPFIPFIKIPQNIIQYEALISQFIILGLIITSIFEKIQSEYSINLFLSLLVLYQMVNVVKRIATIMNYDSGLISYNIGSMTQYAFAIIFAFININTKNFPLYISPSRKEPH